MVRKVALILIDIALTALAGVAALFMRFGFDFQEMAKYSPSVWIYVLVSTVIYIINGNHRVIWAYASPSEGNASRNSASNSPSR